MKCKNIKNSPFSLLPIIVLVFLIAVPFINMLIPPTSPLNMEYGEESDSDAENVETSLFHWDHAEKDYSFMEIISTLLLVGLAVLSFKLALTKGVHQRNRVFWKIVAVGFVVLSLEELTDFLFPLYNILLYCFRLVLKSKYEFMANDDLFDIVELIVAVGFFCYIFKTEKVFLKARLSVFAGLCAHISYVLFDLADEYIQYIHTIHIEFFEEFAQFYTFGFYFLAFFYILTASKCTKISNFKE